MSNVDEAVFALGDLARLVKVVETDLYNPEPDHVQMANTDMPMVQAGDRHHTKAPCSVDSLDILSYVDQLLPLLPVGDLPPTPPREQPGVPPQSTPPAGASRPHRGQRGEHEAWDRRARSTHLHQLHWETSTQGREISTTERDAILRCWTQVRKAMGLTYAGQRSLHEPMSVEEISQVLGIGVDRVISLVRRGKLTEWKVAGQTLYQIPVLRG